MSRDDHRPADTIGGMGGGRRVAGSLLTIALLAGCREPAAERSAFDALPRDGITLAQRATWRGRLHWSDECESAFQASHAGDSGGVTITALRPGGSLVEVICAAGSYQPSVVRFKLAGAGDAVRAIGLTFPVYSSDDGRQLALSRDTEVWGESAVDAARGEVAILTVARQTADCGVWTRYSLEGEQPAVLAAAARLDCPTPPGAPASPSAASPPAGWTAIGRKD